MPNQVVVTANTTLAAPFHPDGVQPRAACPQCVRDRSDDSPRELFPIRGLDKGQRDPIFPAEWLRCPPIKLDGSIEGMEAVRVSDTSFQGTMQPLTQRSSSTSV